LDITYKLSKKTLTYERIKSTIAILLFILVVLIMTLLKYIYTWNQWWNSYYLIILITIISIVSGTFEIIFIEKIKQRNWSIYINNNYIELRYGGILKRTNQVIPIDKIQHFDKIENPLLRKYGLHIFKISTIAYIHELPALTSNQTEKLSVFLTNTIYYRNERNKLYD